MKKILSPAYSLKLKNIILFLNQGLIFFQMVIFATLFRRCPTLWKSTLKMATFFWRCLTLFNSTLKYKNTQRWNKNTQRCFNVYLFEPLWRAAFECSRKKVIDRMTECRDKMHCEEFVFLLASCVCVYVCVCVCVYGLVIVD